MTGGYPWDGLPFLFICTAISQAIANPVAHGCVLDYFCHI